MNVSDSVITTLRQIIRAVDLQSRNLVKNYGLTGPQLIILKSLAENNHSTVGEIAKSVSLSQATMTNILDRLESRGMIKKKRDFKDKRRVIVSIEQLSLDILKKKPPVLQDRFLSEFNKLKEWEQTQILSTLQRVAEMMKAEEIAAPPMLVTGSVSATVKEVAEFLEDNETGIEGSPINSAKA